MNTIRLMLQCFPYNIFNGKPFDVKHCTLCLYSGMHNIYVINKVILPFNIGILLHCYLMQSV